MNVTALGLRASVGFAVPLLFVVGCGTNPSASAPDVPAANSSAGAAAPIGAAGNYLGIPTPAFGLAERPGPVSLVADGSGLLEAVPAGAVVEVLGTHGDENVRCNGTAASPAFIVGGAGHRITGSWAVRGSYCILEGLTFQGAEAGVGIGGDHIALRRSDISGPYRGGSPSAGVATGDGASDIVIYANKVHDRGDMGAGFDQDAHGISPGQRSTRIWILENELYRNSGDGIQVNPYPYESGYNTIRYVYIGKNRAYSNKQSGIHVKQSSDIVVSQNEVFASTPSDSSPGACVGYQYGTDRIWFIGNNLHDCTMGIFVGGDLGGEPDGRNSYYVRNNIHDITSRPGTCGDGGPWECAALRITGGQDHWIIQDKFDHVSSGVHAVRARSVKQAGNVFTNIEPGGADFVTEGVTVSAADAESVYATFQRLYGLDIRH